MKGYTALVSAHFRTLLQYRAAALGGLGTQLFWGLIRVMIFQAFYSANVDPQPMELADVITYIWLSQAFFIMLPWMADRELQALIRTGGVSYELLRPLDLYAAWYSRPWPFARPRPSCGHCLCSPPPHSSWDWRRRTRCHLRPPSRSPRRARSS